MAGQYTVVPVHSRQAWDFIKYAMKYVFVNAILHLTAQLWLQKVFSWL